MKKKILLMPLALLLAMSLVATGCPAEKTGPGGITVPSGFTKMGIQVVVEGVTSTVYLGSGTAADAASSFKTAFQAAGWTFMGEGVVPAGYTGAWFEKGDEEAFIQAMQVEDQVTVTVIVAPKEVEEAPVEEVTPEEVGPPTSDVDGEDISDVPRYPGSIRASYMSVSFGDGGRMSTIGYITSASVDEVLRFYKKELSANGWIDIMEMQMEDTFSLAGYKERASAQVHISPDVDYPNYTSVTIIVDIAALE